MKRTGLAAPDSLARLQKGQLRWAGSVTSVGKTLVRCRRYKGQAKGAKFELPSKVEPEKHLSASQALLVTEQLMRGDRFGTKRG